MVLSFHPVITGDKNILCAGRQPGISDLAAIRKAFAVILPQGCSKTLYDLAKNNCKNVFPNYDARFSYPGKIGQIELFRQAGKKHPGTYLFSELSLFYKQFKNCPKNPPFEYPFIFKFDWGGEGETVFRILNALQFKHILDQAANFEKTGQKGFLIQEFIPEAYRTLRYVVIGTKIFCYWRVQEDTKKFKANFANGSRIKKKVSPLINFRTESELSSFLGITKINLAGFDFIYSKDGSPLFLEINYFFGRKGIGGSEIYYDILQAEIEKWINKL